MSARFLGFGVKAPEARVIKGHAERVFVATSGLAVHDPLGWRRAVNQLSAEFGATGYCDTLACHSNGKLQQANWNRIREGAETNLVQRYEAHQTRVLAAGHSYGALAQLCAAAKHPDKVAGLILAAPAFEIHWLLWILLWFVKLTKYTPLWLLWRILWVPIPGGDGGFGSIPVLVGASILDGQRDAWYAMEKLEKLGIPVLIVHGLSDKVCTPRGTFRAAELLEGRKGVLLLYVSGVKHDLLIGEGRTEVFETIRSWLTSAIGWQ